jgi:putative DNA primase/helicase
MTASPLTQNPARNYPPRTEVPERVVSQSAQNDMNLTNTEDNTSNLPDVPASSAEIHPIDREAARHYQSPLSPVMDGKAPHLSLRDINVDPQDSDDADGDECPEVSGDIVSYLRALLGNDVVLLPIPSGRKGPVEEGWQATTIARMSDQNYLERLARGNIGILLGVASGGLCTIDIDSDEGVEPFLALNPRLAATLRTKRVRGSNLWIRITGTCPATVRLRTNDGLEWGEWRGDGGQTVIHGQAIDRKKGETEPTQYRILQCGPVAEISFDDIVWPEHLVPPCVDNQQPTDAMAALEARYGMPFYRDAKGKPRKLNEAFWAGLYASENHIVWEPVERAFFKYNECDGIYQVASADKVKNEMSSRLLEASREMNTLWLEMQRSDRTLSALAAQLQGIVEEREAFQKQRTSIVLGNGVLDLAGSGTFRDFSPEIRIRHKSPINFDVDARCPRFLAELVLPAVHPEDVTLLQKYSGMALLGDNLIQRMLVLDGESGRGKTQFANALQGVIGRENVSELRTKFLGERFETYRFLRKTLLVGVDVTPDFLSTKGASVLKGLVGGDWFDVERKKETESFPMQGKFCAVVTSNTRLRVLLQGDVGAWRRRLLIVRYEAPPPQKKIPDFGQFLVREEGSGILNWCLAGLDALLRDVAALGDIAQTARQQGIVDSLLEESDSLRVFLMERLRRVSDGTVSVQELVEAYAAYCPERGWRALPITEIHSALEGLMLDLFQMTKAHSIQRDGKSVRGFHRVSLC